jgi:hypothetical protein
MPERVAQEMDGAALHGALSTWAMACLSPLVGVGDDQLHPGKATPHQRAEELAPARLGLGRGHLQADDLPLAAGVHPVGDHQRPVLDPAAGPHLLHLGVQPQLRVGILQGPLTERRHLLIQATAQPRDGVLGHPARPSASTSRSTLRVDTPLTYASWTTATSACSLRRRGSRKPGKYDPERSLGMASSIDPPGCPRPAPDRHCAGPPGRRCALYRQPQRPRSPRPPSAAQPATPRPGPAHRRAHRPAPCPAVPGRSSCPRRSSRCSSRWNRSTDDPEPAMADSPATSRASDTTRRDATGPWTAVHGMDAKPSSGALHS